MNKIGTVKSKQICKNIFPRMSFKLLDFHTIISNFENDVNSATERLTDNLMESSTSLQRDGDVLVCCIDKNKAKNTVNKTNTWISGTDGASAWGKHKIEEIQALGEVNKSVQRWKR